MTAAERDLDDAVRAAVAEHSPDDPVVGWVVVAAVLSGDDESTMVVLPADGQPAFSTAGLLHLGLRDGLGSQL